MTIYLMVMTNFPDKKLAQKICKLVVKKSLACCCQIIGPIESHYIWENRAEVSKEYLCLIKTTAKQYKKIEKIIKDNHPYQVPEILAVNIKKGHKQYLDWLNKPVK